VVDEPLEDLVVRERDHAGLVIDLIADDGRVLRVAGDDLADDALGVEQERGVRVVDLLTCAPAHLLAAAQFDVDLGQLPDEPRRCRIGGRSEDHLDPVLVRRVEHGREPLETELAVVGLPRRPDRLAHADDGEARLPHETHVLVEPR
jgi:hypothetical protein